MNGDLDIKVSPVSLVESEDAFLNDLQNYIMSAPSKLDGKEIYFIRNKSKTGIGFFESRYFFPDFILWVLDGDKQYITFIDPKGIGRVGIKDEKIQLSHIIKEKQNQLCDEHIELNSIILSYTRYGELPKYGASKEMWEDSGVLFMIDDHATYIEKLFGRIIPSQ